MPWRRSRPSAGGDPTADRHYRHWRHRRSDERPLENTKPVHTGGRGAVLAIFDERSGCRRSGAARRYRQTYPSTSRHLSPRQRHGIAQAPRVKSGPARSMEKRFGFRSKKGGPWQKLDDLEHARSLTSSRSRPALAGLAHARQSRRGCTKGSAGSLRGRCDPLAASAAPSASWCRCVIPLAALRGGFGRSSTPGQAIAA